MKLAICLLIVAVIQYARPSQERTVRLVGGHTSSEGRVEVSYGGTWKTVCRDRWDMNDADVVCRSLGFPGAFGTGSSARPIFGQGSRPSRIYEFICHGNESNILDCPNRPTGYLYWCSSGDAEVTCKTMPSDGDVRLTGGNSSSEGRVEISFNGTWGPICDSRWNFNDANAVCRSLGFRGAFGAVKGALFGPGTGPIYLFNFRCSGTESNFLDCPHQTHRDYNCHYGKDVGVRCKAMLSDGDVRLVGGVTPSEGRVEISYNGMWGTLYGYKWTMKDANVVCRSLGFPGAFTVDRRAGFGHGTGPILLDDAGCLGDEANILDCPQAGVNFHVSYHRGHIGVRCKTMLSDGNVRLVGGNSSSEGRVEISFNGTWRTVGHEWWDINDANVVCRSLGFSGALIAVRNYGFSRGNGSFLLGGFSCRGTESNILDCPNYSDVSLRYREHARDAGVRCKTMPSDGDVRLVDGLSFSEGRVEVAYNGTWGTICDFDWNLFSADVVCRSLGFPGAIEPVRNDKFGRGTGPIVLYYVRCWGREEKISQCRSSSYGPLQCRHGGNAGVRCQTMLPSDGDVRLAGGGSSGARGRVEIFYNRTWGRVCHDTWDIDYGNVVCRSFGFPGAVYAYSSNDPIYVHGRGKGPFFLHDVSCRGNESSILDCSNAGLGVHECHHNEDAEVTCDFLKAQDLDGSCQQSCCVNIRSSCDAGGCYCDASCTHYGDCCQDYFDVCPNVNSSRISTPHPNQEMMFVADWLEGKIYVAGLSSIGLDSLTFSPLPLISAIRPRAVDYDPQNQTVFWTESSGLIRRGKFYGTDQRIIADAGVEDPRGIALDARRRKVFWTDDGLDQIVSANFDGSSQEILVSTDIYSPRSIIIQEEEGIMIWTDCNYPASRIERANLDDRDRYIMVDSNILLPNGLAFNDNGTRIYWCDASYDRIESADLWGNDRIVHLTATAIYPFDLAFFDDTIIWTDRVRDALGVSPIDNSNSYSFHNDGIFRYPYGIHVYKDIDECTVGYHRCDINAICTNTKGSYTCSCYDGYTGDGFNCIDIDECGVRSRTCDTNATCINTQGSYTCSCDDGYSSDGFTCLDTDECIDGSHRCDINAACTNTQGSYTCSCNDGYMGDGFTCIDINECSSGSNRCHINATCTNTQGSYTCTCKEGYPGDGFICGSNGMMFVADRIVGKIFMTLLYSGGLHSLNFSPLSLSSALLPRAVDYDPRTRTVFWTETFGSIRRGNINGTDERVIADDGVIDPTGLALDTIRRKVFWTDDGLNQIVSANFDGSSQEILVNTDIYSPRSIIIQEEEGVMFWTDINYPDSSRIERANLDGGDRHIIVNSSINVPTGLAFDDNGRRIYWCDASLDIIESVDLWGNARMNHVTARYVYPFDLVVFDGRIIWTDWVDGALGVSLIGSNSYSFHYRGIFRYPYSIHVYKGSP